MKKAIIWLLYWLQGTIRNFQESAEKWIYAQLDNLEK